MLSGASPCRKSIGLASEEDKLIYEGTPIRLRSEVGGDQALGLDAEGGVDAMAARSRAVRWFKVSLGRFLAG